MYQAKWSAVRERILSRELACVSDMLAIANDNVFKLMIEFELFDLDIDAIERDVQDYGDSDENYANFKRDLFAYLMDTNSQLVSAESSAIAIVWLDLLRQKHQVD